MQNLKESIIKNALEHLNWPLLKAHLDDAGLDSDTLAVLLGHIRRTGSLIFPYPNRAKAMLREKFFGQLASHLDSCLGKQSVALLKHEIELLGKIEDGYRGILSLLDRCAISKLPAATRASAYVSRAAHQFKFVADEVDRVLRGEQRNRSTLRSAPNR